MHPDDREILTILNGLIEVCRDSAECFARDARSANSPVLGDQLRDSLSERIAMGQKLQAAVHQLGGFAIQGGTTAGQLNSAAAAGDILAPSDEALIEDCLRWEREALAAYEDAACERLPQDIAELMQFQAGNVRRSLAMLDLLAVETGLRGRHDAE